MRIVLDAMGSDTHPDPEVEAAVQAADLWGDPVFLVGRQEVLEAGCTPSASARSACASSTRPRSWK